MKFGFIITENRRYQRHNSRSILADIQLGNNLLKTKIWKNKTKIARQLREKMSAPQKEIKWNSRHLLGTHVICTLSSSAICNSAAAVFQNNNKKNFWPALRACCAHRSIYTQLRYVKVQNRMNINNFCVPCAPPLCTNRARRFLPFGVRARGREKSMEFLFAQITI